MDINLKSFGLGLLIAVLAACSSDDNDDDNDGSPSQPPPSELKPLVITEENAFAVASAVLGPLALVSEINADDELLQEVGVNAVQLSAGDGVYANLRALIDPIDYFAALGRQDELDVDPIVTDNLTQRCPGGAGTVTLTWEFTDNNFPPQFLAIGDMLRLEFDRCTLEDWTINGVSSLEVKTPVVIGPDPGMGLEPPWTLDFLVVLESLSLSNSERSLTLAGEVRLREETNDGFVFNTTISGSELSLKIDGDRERLRNFQFFSNLDDSKGSYSIDAFCGLGDGATLESTRLGGIVQFCHRTNPFKGMTGEPPYTGTLNTKGGQASDGIGPSRLATEALNDANCVELRVDTDGNGIFDWVEFATWASLLSGIPDDGGCS